MCVCVHLQLEISSISKQVSLLLSRSKPSSVSRWQAVRWSSRRWARLLIISAAASPKGSLHNTARLEELS